MVQNPSAPSTVGSSTFIPDRFLEKWAIGEFSAPQGNDLESAIKKVFGLNDDDQYVYHAIATVTLRQVQSAINQRDKHGLHAWYRDDAGQQVNDSPLQAPFDRHLRFTSSDPTPSNSRHRCLHSYIRIDHFDHKSIDSF